MKRITRGVVEAALREVRRKADEEEELLRTELSALPSPNYSSGPSTECTLSARYQALAIILPVVIPKQDTTAPMKAKIPTFIAI